MCFANATCQETLYVKIGTSALSLSPGHCVLALEVYSLIASYGLTRRLSVTGFGPLHGIWHMVKSIARRSTMLIRCHTGPLYLLR